MTIQDCLMVSEKELLKEATGLKGTVTQHKDHFIYVDRGHPTCLVAHVDTVRGRDRIDLRQKHSVITNRHGILGADDRAGVYALFALEHTGVNLLFTNYEESGGKGAVSAANRLEFTGVNLFIELDRRGCNEYVYYSWRLPKATKQYIESYGFIEDYGSYSDIAEFEQFGIPAVNLSIGYYNQHTTRESLHIDEMNLTIERVKAMISNPPKRRHKASFRDDSYELPWDRDFKRKYKKKRGNVLEIDPWDEEEDVLEYMARKGVNPDKTCATCGWFYSEEQECCRPGIPEGSTVVSPDSTCGFHEVIQWNV